MNRRWSMSFWAWITVAGIVFSSVVAAVAFASSTGQTLAAHTEKHKQHEAAIIEIKQAIKETQTTVREAIREEFEKAEKKKQP